MKKQKKKEKKRKKRKKKENPEKKYEEKRIFEIRKRRTIRYDLADPGM